MKVLKNWGLDQNSYPSSRFIEAKKTIFLNLIFCLLVTDGLRLLNTMMFVMGSAHFFPNDLGIQKIEFAVYGVGEILFLLSSTWRSWREKKNLRFVSACYALAIGAFFTFFTTVLIDGLVLFSLSLRQGGNLSSTLLIASGFIRVYVTEFGFLYLYPFTFFALSLFLRKWVTHQKFEKEGIERSTFGSAKFASEKDLRKMGAYSEKGALFGKDEKDQYLRSKLCNRLIIAPPGTGKSAGVIIPALLTENRSILVHDVKGELYAVTARYRHEHFNREIVVIDPFGVTKQQSYAMDKPLELQKEFTINLLDYIPVDEGHRDRSITALVKSMVAREGGGAALHWEENAKILLGGFIDYVLKKYPSPSLVDVHELMLQNLHDMNVFLEKELFPSGGRSTSAASQILKTAPEERGSIYTTTYRQIKWLADSNLAHTLAVSNMDLRAFIHGNMDIYVVMPEDQVLEQSRVVRMIVSMITSMIVQLDPSQLPESKTLFIFDELGQLEYCDDIEKMIEVLRARGIIIWAIFQAFSQVKLYKKPDLFLNMDMKQFFRIDDPETMRMIQQLAGKKTILQENSSENKNSSSQGSRLSHSHSKGEGASYHEVGVDLIHLNEIREMDTESQYVFIAGQKPIKCRKIPYFKEPLFTGRFDRNPLEIERT